MSDPIIDHLKKLAESHPALKQALADKFGLNQASDAREKIKAVSDQLGKDGVPMSHVMYALIINLALIAYIGNYGDRAKTRDQIAVAIDNAIGGIDEDARKNGLHETLTAYKDAKERGDTVSAKRLLREQIEGGKTFGFEY